MKTFFTNDNKKRKKDNEKKEKKKKILQHFTFSFSSPHLQVTSQEEYSLAFSP